MTPLGPGPGGNTPRGEARRIAARLLDVVRTLAGELQPHSRLEVRLDSDLDRELGFDSLSRVELQQRLERAFDVRLPERLQSAAETPRDLLNAVLESGAGGSSTPATELAETPTLGAAHPVPATAATLPEILAWHVAEQGERTHAQVYEMDAERPVSISFAALQAGAEAVASGLQTRGHGRGDSVAIMLPTGRAYLESFFGVLLAGAVPVPIYPPARPSQLEDHLRRHVGILTSANARALIAFSGAGMVSDLLGRQVRSLTTVTTPEALAAAGGALSPVRVGADDLALLQFTSGSTGAPKGVMLSHADLLANIRAMGEWVRAGPDDVFVSWLPLYHDMGLIGAWLGSLYYAMLAVLMPPTAFLARPWRWLWAIHQHRGTISAAPNFAYELCRQKAPAAQLEGLDLRSWRLACNGAEPVSPRTLVAFTARFAAHGFRPAAMTPVYGLAEVGVGLSFPPLDRGPRIDRVLRPALERQGRAEPAGEADAADEVVEVVSCGLPLPGYEIRIVDRAGRELPERQAGRLEFRGPSATRGYVGNPQATAQLFRGDWLDSGDLAYLAGGEVFLTSRVKDLIIRAGRNLYPYELEEAVGDLPEVRKGCVAVFGSPDSDTGIERLIVVAEHRPGTDPEALRRRIVELGSDRVGIAPDDVVLVPPHTVPKTSSGKIRRSTCRALYETGELRRGPVPVWRQVLHLRLAGVQQRWVGLARSAADAAYAGWGFVVFGLVAVAGLAGVALPGSLEARWSWLRRCSRAALKLLGLPVEVCGIEHLAGRGGAVLVANHASYLDGLVLLACLPRPVVFVAKAELRRRPLARWFLQRIATQFVERFDAAQGTADAQRLTALARRGTNLLFFPEGTFTRAPGLLPFHLGAFLTAASCGLPVVPLTLRGSRAVLRGDSWFLRRGAIAVMVREPLVPVGTGWSAALDLRDRARRAILEGLDEPDLGR